MLHSNLIPVSLYDSGSSFACYSSSRHSVCIIGFGVLIFFNIIIIIII